LEKKDDAQARADSEEPQKLGQKPVSDRPSQTPQQQRLNKGQLSQVGKALQASLMNSVRKSKVAGGGLEFGAAANVRITTLKRASHFKDSKASIK